jgi:Tfp pilus assembly protein PilN
MIRINLLGQARPKAGRRPVPLGAMIQTVFLLFAIVAAVAALWIHDAAISRDVNKVQDQITKLQREKARLQTLKQQVEAFQKQREFLQRRIGVIEQLQRDRTGGQELLDMVATTVSRTDSLWLNSMTKKGSALDINGTGASLNSVANFISQLKRSGYFQKIEIKESKQDDRTTGVVTFLFTLSAEIAPPQPVKPATAAGPPTPPAPPRKG